MGHDIITLGNHQLNTSHVQLLAQDLAARLNASICYGYQDTNDCFRAPAITPAYKFVELGVIHPKQGNHSYLLQDNHYQAKQQFTSESFCQYYSLLTDPTGKEVADIFPGYVDCQQFYYTRWWQFCRQFTRESDSDSGFSDLNEYRSNLRLFLQQIGGDEMVLLDDQGATACLANEQYTWQQILDELNRSFRDSTCYIPAFMQAGIPRNPGDYPLAFYDDFSDM